MNRTSPPSAGPDAKGHGRPNSLGMNGKQLDAILGDPGAAGLVRPDKRRKFARWAFRQSSVDLHIEHPGGSVTRCRVACRNLSCGGLSVVHSAFIYPGSSCVVYLPKRGGAPSAPVPGVIVRCTHVTGMVHEIGIRFDQPIAATDYVDNDPLAGQFSLEVVEPESLVGTLLLVEDSPLDQKLVQHYLRNTSIRIRTAETAEQASQIARDGCDVVLCDLHLGGDAAEQAVEVVRRSLPEVPVIIATADASAATAERVRRMPINAFLAKPFTDSLLQRALGEFLVARQERPADSGVGADAALGAELARELTEYNGKLEASLREGDPASCYVVCQQIGATAQSARRSLLARLAQEASATLARTMSIPESERAVRELIGACAKAAA